MHGRVLIVDDHDLLREGVVSLLSHQSDLVQQASNGAEALSLARLSMPDLVIMDISMPKLNGIQTARGLIDLSPAVKIILFTQQLGSELIRAAFHAGIRGYVAKQSAGKELLLAIQIVQAGGFYITPTAKLKEFEGRAGKPMFENPAGEIQSPLTPRQLDVLRLMKSN
jgi:DNA-binding NarL/FixJ family response regulator